MNVELPGSITAVCEEHLARYSDFLIADLVEGKVGVNDIGMAAVFLRWYGKVLRSPRAIEHAEGMGALLQARFSRAPAFTGGLLNDPIVSYVALELLHQLEGTIFEQKLPLLVDHTNSPGDLELLQGRLGHVVALNDQAGKTAFLKELSDRLMTLQGATGVLEEKRYQNLSTPHRGAEYGEVLNLGTAHGNLGYFIQSIRSGSVRLAETFYDTFSHIGQRGEVPIADVWPWPLSNRLPAAGRLAWCYGDLMLGHANLLFGSRFRHHPKATEAIKSARRIFVRCLEGREVLTGDQHFCHGDCGVVQILLRSLEIESIDLLREIVLSWPQTLPADPRRWVTNGGAGESTSRLLYGDLGIALVLLSILDPKGCQWDKLFLLS